SDLQRLRQELARLPADPAIAVTQAREAFEALEAIARAVPPLERFRLRREELRQAQCREKTAEKTTQEVEIRGKKLSAEVEAFRTQLDEATRTTTQAGEQATIAKTEHVQARESLRELNDLGGAKVCRHCGQSLTDGHVKEEKKRRTAAINVADERRKQ